MEGEMRENLSIVKIHSFSSVYQVSGRYFDVPARQAASTKGCVVLLVLVHLKKIKVDMDVYE
jgi:hypothetical protein